jgi:hypothetical protein
VARLLGLLDQVAHQRLELGARELDVEVLRPGGVGSDEGQVDLGLRRRGELDLGLFGLLFKTLQSEFVLAQIDRLLLFELVGEVVDDALVEVLAAQEGVAVGRLHLEDAVADLQDRDVEGAAAEVVDRDRARALLLKPVGERRRGRLVDDAQDLKPRDLAGILGRLALAVVEIGGDGDHRLLHLLAQIVLGGLLHLLQDEARDLGGCVFLALGLDPGVAVLALDDLVGHEVDVLFDLGIGEAPTDQALDGEQRVLWIGDRLTFGGLADEAFLVVGKGDHRGRCACPLGVLQDLALAALHDGDARIGRAQIDTDDFAHLSLTPFRQTLLGPISAP